MTNLHWLNWVSEIQAIAQNGITFANNEFDKERYSRLLEIAAEITSKHSNNSFEEIMQLFAAEKGYMTPKVDVRSYILKENQLLLVRERADGLWTLPGGYADINESPSEAVIRETREESGFDVSVTKLLALWDKQKHEHPPQWPHVYKFFFACTILSGHAQENIEVSEIQFFNLNELPPLSTHRVTKNQIHRLHEASLGSGMTLFD